MSDEFSSAFSAAYAEPVYVPITTLPGILPGSPDPDCSWPIDPACSPTEWASYPADVQARAAGLATATLRRLSGYRVGGCPVVVRPCVQSCTSLLAVGRGWGPSQLPNGDWVNSCGCNPGDCGCSSLCEVVLAPPVGRIDWVSVDGQVVPPENYRVDGNRLVWTGGGSCPWPSCQDMAANLDQPGTFGVSYLNAHTPDALAAAAAGVLAIEFAKACTGSKCRLPATVTAVSRQGVNFDLAASSFANGRTGIREVDAWIELWCPPGSPSRQASVWWPNSRHGRVTA
jgi:hypothetical protein